MAAEGTIDPGSARRARLSMEMTQRSRAMLFVDRVHAGRELADRLERFRGKPAVVLALPRGGVPVAFEVALALGFPLDVILVRKLGVPSQPELAMGAIGEDGVKVINAAVVSSAGIRDDQLAAVEQRERAELDRRAQRFRGDRPRIDLVGKTALVIDDGIATGSTARAACEVARAHGATRIVLAAPVAPPGWTERLGEAADEYVCVATPEQFWAIGQFYGDFTQTTDAEVIDCLSRARSLNQRPAAAFQTTPDEGAPNDQSAQGAAHHS